MNKLTRLVLISISTFYIVPSFAGSASVDREKKREWAILTFMNGFNDLDPFGVKDMNEMETYGSSKRIHVVTQWASLATKQVRRVYVEFDDNPREVTSPVIENLGQIDMGDYRNLVDFVRWAAKHYPAKRYFVNIWNHGTGWHLNRSTDRPPASRDVSYDHLSGNRITTEQLGLAAAEIARELGQKIDIMASDSCLMAMAEVVAQMKGSIDHFIGSEEIEPADGWPYDTFLSEISRGKKKKSPREIAQILTKNYIASYPVDSRQLTLSGLNMAIYPRLATAVRALAAAIRDESILGRKRVIDAIATTRSFVLDDYKDLGDLVDQIAKQPDIKIRPEIFSDVKSALKEFVVANAVSPDYYQSQGVAVWFPDFQWQFDSYKDRYRALIFNQDTHWIDAVEATLRVLPKRP